MEEGHRHVWHHVSLEHADPFLQRIESLLRDLNRKVDTIMIDQATFDTDLAALVAAIGTLTAAVDAWIAAHPAVDLTAEDQSVLNASAAVAAELANITPAPAAAPAAEPTPAPADAAPADTTAPADLGAAQPGDAAPADAAPVDAPVADAAPADAPAADAATVTDPAAGV